MTNALVHKKKRHQKRCLFAYFECILDCKKSQWYFSFTIKRNLLYFSHGFGLQKNADGQGARPISVNALVNPGCSLKVMALLLCMHENIPMTIFADKNSDGEYIPETVSIKFNNKEINRRLCSYMNGLDIEARVSQSREQYKANPDDAAALEDLDAMLQMIKLNVVDCNQIIKKD